MLTTIHESKNYPEEFFPLEGNNLVTSRILAIILAVVTRADPSAAASFVVHLFKLLQFSIEVALGFLTTTTSARKFSFIGLYKYVVVWNPSSATQYVCGPIKTFPEVRS